MTYLIVFIVPVIFNFYTYYKSISIINDETGKVINGILLQFRDSVDRELEYVKNLSEHIVWNQEIKWLVNVGSAVEAESSEDVVKILNMFRVLKITNSAADRMYVCSRYNGDDDFVVFPDDYIGKNVDWKDLISSEKEGFVSFDIEFPGSRSDSLLAYIQPFPITGPDVTDAYSVIFINRETILRKIENLEWSKAGTAGYIKDSFGEIVASSVNINLYEGYSNGSFRSNDIVVKTIKSLYSDWTYHTIIPRGYYYATINSLRNTIIITLFFCFVIVAFAAYKFTQQTCKPISGILSMLNPDEDLTALTENKKTGSYLLIEESVRDIINENRSIRNRLSQQELALKNAFLSRFLRGRPLRSGLSVDEVCKVHNIQFEWERFALIYFYVPPDDFYKGIQFINRWFEESDSDSLKGIVTEIEGQFIVILNIDSENIDESKEILVNTAEEILAKASEDEYLKMSIAVSKVYETLSVLPVAYQEVQEGIEYSVLLGCGNIVYYWDLEQKRDSDTLKSGLFIEYELKVLNYAKAGDYEAAYKTILTMIDEFYFDSKSLAAARTRLYGLINLITEIVGIIGENLNLEIFEDISPVDGILHCKTVPEVRGEIDRIFSQVNMSIKKKDKKTMLSETGSAYIRKYYNDKNLSAAMIAEYLGITVPHLSMTFKKQKGIGILDYIHKIRIDKAKKLLAEGDLSIKDVSDRTGYYSDIAFIRAFKRYEGITPGKYRASVLKK